MPIYFNNTLNHNPFQFDSIGNNWTQEAVRRTQGYPQYHYLQTEEGCGILVLDSSPDHAPYSACLPFCNGKRLDHMFRNLRWFFGATVIPYLRDGTHSLHRERTGCGNQSCHRPECDAF